MSSYYKITSNELKKLLTDVNTQIIDVRPIEYYNGWRKFNEKRGGHIKNARTLPIKWIDYLDWIEIVKSKGITEKNTIIIYSDSYQDSVKVADRFKESGYKNIKLYNKFVEEWISDESLPMHKLDRYNHLVSAEWVQKLLVTGTAPEYTNNKFVICHCHYQNPKDFELGHIPKAVSVDSNTLDSQITWNLRSP